MIGIRVVGDMRVVGEPDEDDGIITRLYCMIYDVTESDDDDGGEKEVEIGGAEVAIIHVGQADNHGVSLVDALDADSGELEALYWVYFDENGEYKDKFVAGGGRDLLYISDVKIEESYRERNVDLAIVRQLSRSFGGGCELVVIPYESEPDAKRWSTLGFVVSTDGEPTGFMHHQQAFVAPRVVETDEPGRFKVVPNLTPDEIEKVN